MPLYKLEIFKSTIGSKPWCNTYHWQDTTLEGAVSGGAGVAAAEQFIHATYVQFDRVRVSQVVPNTAAFTTLLLGTTGSRSAATNPTPLWNVFVVNFNVAGGRPSAKLFRGPVLTGDINGELVLTGALSDLADYVSDIGPLLSTDGIEAGLVDESGNPFESVQALNRIRERSRDRRRKRTAGPPVLG